MHNVVVRLRICSSDHECAVDEMGRSLRLPLYQPPSVKYKQFRQPLHRGLVLWWWHARVSLGTYGVLQELARTSIRWEGIDKRLVEELNIINALSGGSFTAAYYGLYGDRIFQDFEHRFLRKNWESELRSRIFRSPSNWLRLWSPYFGRAHIFSELLDEALFDGHTFGDLVTGHRRPMIFIHASDMVSLSRFEFNQFQFDLICSDLNQLPISVATASSAALPVILSPISITNYAGQCGYHPSMLLQEAKKTSLGRQRATELRSYLDPKKRPYIHLLDGGLSDNIGRSIISCWPDRAYFATVLNFSD
jgi:NTE family protein